MGAGSFKGLASTGRPSEDRKRWMEPSVAAAQTKLDPRRGPARPTCAIADSTAGEACPSNLAGAVDQRGRRGEHVQAGEACPSNLAGAVDQRGWPSAARMQCSRPVWQVAKQ